MNKSWSVFSIKARLSPIGPPSPPRFPFLLLTPEFPPLKSHCQPQEPWCSLLPPFRRLFPGMHWPFHPPPTQWSLPLIHYLELKSSHPTLFPSLPFASCGKQNHCLLHFTHMDLFAFFLPILCFLVPLLLMVGPQTPWTVSHMYYLLS
jgi:hypothetical protein